jgi:hypothetical protein
MNRQTASPDQARPAPPIPQSSTNDPIDNATLELLASWRIEDAAKNQEDVQAAEKEIAEFKQSMNDNRSRSGESFLYP